MQSTLFFGPQGAVSKIECELFFFHMKAHRITRRTKWSKLL